jgi:hypothetical protein
MYRWRNRFAEARSHPRCKDSTQRGRCGSALRIAASLDLTRRVQALPDVNGVPNGGYEEYPNAFFRLSRAPRTDSAPRSLGNPWAPQWRPIIRIIFSIFLSPSRLPGFRR